MCGICGYIHLDRSRRASEPVLKGMLSTLALRGPDDEGSYLKENVALGHRRLSIIDLRTGHQPILNEDGSVIVICNGEIYNFGRIRDDLEKRGHRFRTRSDTEVIAHAYEEYGEDCLKLFNGMFAFAVWDSKNEALFMARDRFGKKPLYYAIFDNQFIFGSELKTILKHPSARREIDTNSLARYLSYEYVPSPHSIFRNIWKLGAGHKLSLKDQKVKVDSYWDLDLGRKHDLGLKDTKVRMLELLKESVRKRLISDVPLGVFLSGGIDSSAVVAMMAELRDPKDIKTFSIGFKEAAFDESSDARRVAEHFGTDHHEGLLDPETMLEIFPKVLDILDEPFADSSIIPTYLVSRFTRQHVKVALGGDGGDELFFGYPSFAAHRLDSYLKALPAPFVKTACGMLDALSRREVDYKSFRYDIKRFLKALAFPQAARHQAWIGSFTPPEQEGLFLPGRGIDYSIDNVYEPTLKFFKKAEALDPFKRAMYIYMKTYMSDDILAKVDRASMANSLEVRAPFLDTEFAEFAASIPPSWKFRGLEKKWILKDALKGKLPEHTLRKAKRGFAVPVARWLKEDLKGLLMSAFDERKIKAEGIFDPVYVKRMAQEFIANKNDTRKEVWALFMFEMWYDRWMK